VVAVTGFVLLVRREREYARDDEPESVEAAVATRTDVA